MSKCKPAVEILLSWDPLVYPYGFFLTPWFRFSPVLPVGRGKPTRSFHQRLYTFGESLNFFR